MTDETSTIGTATAPRAATGAVFLEGPSPRTRSIPLRWPLLVDGVEYRQLTLRRINGQEAKAYYAATLATLQQGAPVAVYPGLDIGQSVWDALDDDDVNTIEQAIQDFLPERFLPLIALLGKMMGPEEAPEEGAAGPSFSGGLSSDIGDSSPA